MCLRYTLYFFKFIGPLFAFYCYTLCFLFIRTSNFGAKAERSYIFLRFEAENVLKMFLNYIAYTTCILVNHRTRPGNLSKGIA